MPSPTTTIDFLGLVHKSRLLTQEQLDELFGSSVPTDAKQCAAALIRAEMLTSYQAKQLLSGKFRGFFLGAYKILRPIGQGGMGAVYLAEHTSLNRKVAVKVLTADKAKDKLTLERFNREARAAAALDHPNIVRLHDISQGGGVHFLVMEYVEGNDLQTLMAQTGPLHYAQAAEYVAQAAAGLQHAHDRGFIHRDIKPANLMLTKDGAIKILDMGLARSFTDSKDNLTALMAEGDIAGTVDFLSPEQAINSPLDERSDIYSLGATFYALVTGHPPFNGTTAQKLMQHQMKEPQSVVKKLNGRVPPSLSDVIAKMMAKRPNDRVQTAADVIDALGPWLPAVSSGSIVQDPIRQSELTLTGDPTRRLRKSRNLKLLGELPLWRRPAVLIGAGAALVLLVGGVIAAVMTGGDKKPNAGLRSFVPPDNQPQQLPVPNPPSNGTRTTPSGAGGKNLYSLDFTGTAVASRVVTPPGRSIVLFDLSGTPLPGGVTFNHWNGQASATYSISDHAGSRALGMQPTGGNDGVQAHFKCDGLLTALPPSGAAKARLTYALDGTKPANAFFELRVDPYTKFDTVPLPATGGQWRTVELTFTHPTEGGEYELVVRAGEEKAAIDGTVWVKSVELIDPTQAAAAGGPGVVYRLDASKLKPFRKRIDFDISFGGANIREEVPGWQYEVYDKDSSGEAAAEVDDGKVTLAIGSRTGKNAAQFTFQPVKLGTVSLVPGREYQARLEYKTEGVSGNVGVQTINEWKIIGGTSLPSSDTWKTVTFPVTRPEGKDVQFTFGTTALSTGFLRIRSFEIVDQSVATAAPPPPKSNLPVVPVKVDFAAFADGVFALSTDGATAANGQPGLGAAGWTANSFEKDTSGELTVGTVEGGRALTLVNTGGKASAQLYQTTAGPALVAGRSYRLQFEYKATDGTTGLLDVREKDVRNGTDCPYSYRLDPTGGQWEKRTFEIEPTRDYPPVFVVQNVSGQAGNRLSIRSLEIVPLGGK